MNELYWITRLDNVYGAFIGITVVSSCVVFVVFVIRVILDEMEIDTKNRLRKFLKIFTPLLFVGIMGLVFVPNTKEGLIIYGIGGTIDYIKSNDKAKKLPDKVIDALDKYLDTMNEERKEVTPNN